MSIIHNVIFHERYVPMINPKSTLLLQVLLEPVSMSETTVYAGRLRKGSPKHWNMVVLLTAHEHQRHTS